MSRRLLLVESSPTMRNVLEQHVRALGHDVVVTDAYAAAIDLLRRQYVAFDADIVGVIMGWPSVPDEDAAALVALLESVDFTDLPAVVMSTDMRAETRAWAAGRERTAVIPWKDYLGVGALLADLLDAASDVPDGRVVRFDNTDIHLLVVDDSLTIRYSLRDLFERQGYRVSLAGNREEALAAARATRFDVAVLDFYLDASTGDALCRDLVSDPDCGDVVCAILTGTYADHVIKRSLRAGAVECMFKNESSELLLTRIDAIVRFVRQRREVAVDHRRLERVVEALAGAVLVVDAEGRVRHASAPALAELGLYDPDSVVGQPVRVLLGIESLPEVGAAPVAMTWRDATGGDLPVRVSRRALPRGPESLLGFERWVEGAAPAPGSVETVAANPVTANPVAAAGRPDAGVASVPFVMPAPVPAVVPATGPATRPGGVAAAPGPDEYAAVLAKYHLPADVVPFLEQFERHARAVGERPDHVSLLLLGMHEPRSGGVHVPIDAALAKRVEAGLVRLYRRPHHVVALGAHRFGLLIRHSDLPQSYLLTRRLMQMSQSILADDGGPELACSGCLIALTNHPGRPADVLLGQALSGLSVVEQRGVGQALLLDLKRMLPVYPETPGEGLGTGDGGVPG